MLKDTKFKPSFQQPCRRCDSKRPSRKQLFERALLLIALCFFTFCIFKYFGPQYDRVPLLPTRYQVADWLAPPSPLQKLDSKSAFKAVYRPFVTEVSAEIYVDPEGNQHKLGNPVLWHRSLRNGICLVDLDARHESESNVAFYGEHTESVSPGMLNHFAYTLLHGYAYQRIRVPKNGHASQAIRTVQMMARTVRNSKDCQFFVFTQLDVGFRDLGLPMEWIFNRWEVSKDTTLAFATLPTTSGIPGFMIAHASARTQELFDIWLECLHTSLKGRACRLWKQAVLGVARKDPFEPQHLFPKPVNVLCDELDVLHHCLGSTCNEKLVSCASMLLQEQRDAGHIDLNYPRQKLGQAEFGEMEKGLARSIGGISREPLE